MAIINTLREKSWLVIVLVALAMFAFILGDLFGPNSVLRGGPDRSIGTIAGEDIPIDAYEREVEQLKYEYVLQNNRNPDEAALQTIREQAWNQLVFNKAYQEEFDALGLMVTDEEAIDMVQGNNVHPAVQQSFTNPETNTFDAEQVRQFLRNFDQLPPQQQAMWENFERKLPPDRLRAKHEGLLRSTVYVTKAEAERAYQAESGKATFRYLYVPYSAIPDSAVNVEDSELEAYLRDHRQEFQVDDARTLEYVAFEVSPSEADSAYLEQSLKDLRAGFAGTPNDSLFVQTNSDAPQAVQQLSPGALPTQLDGVELRAGGVYGPFANGSEYTLYKVADINDGGEPSVRARHILIKPDGDTPEAKQEARQEAQRIRREIEQGADFADMAREYGTDGTAARGGDLGWFGKGRMVAPFEEAVFDRNATGLLPNVVETRFGYHVIDVTEAPTTQQYVVYQIKKELLPGDEAFDAAYAQADRFAAGANDAASFEAAVAADSLTTGTATNVQKAASRVNDLNNARELVRWAYNDAEVGDVSPVFEADGRYVVALLTGQQEEGDATLENVRDAVTRKVRNARKAELIKEKLTGDDLDAMAAAYDQAKVYEAKDQALTNNSLTSVGFDPKAVGYAFGLARAGKTGQPVATDNGVVVVGDVQYTEAPEIADYNSYVDQVQQRQAGRTAYYIGEAVKDLAEVDDRRYRFY